MLTATAAVAANDGMKTDTYSGLLMRELTAYRIFASTTKSVTID